MGYLLAIRRWSRKRLIYLWTALQVALFGVVLFFNSYVMQKETKPIIERFFEVIPFLGIITHVIIFSYINYFYCEESTSAFFYSRESMIEWFISALTILMSWYVASYFLQEIIWYIFYGKIKIERSVFTYLALIISIFSLIYLFVNEEFGLDFYI